MMKQLNIKPLCLALLLVSSTSFADFEYAERKPQIPLTVKQKEIIAQERKQSKNVKQKETKRKEKVVALKKAAVAIKDDEKTTLAFLEAEKKRLVDEIAQLKAQKQSMSKINEKEQLTQANMFYQTKKYSQAFKIYRELAGKGDANAQAMLGLMYYEGQGTTKNNNEALKWFNKAAQQGNALGQYYLGLAYSLGIATSIDDKKALHWFSQAARQNNVNAQFQLGYIYENGKGTNKNQDEALKWYIKSAEQGNMAAQYNLGLIYNKNEDTQGAIKWFKKAAEQEHTLAMVDLAMLYELSKQQKEALYWYKKAAQNGDDDAQYYLGVLYANGRLGLTQNMKEAKTWYEKSAKLGNHDARIALEYLKNPDAIAKGFSIMVEMKQKYPRLIQLILATESMEDDERQYWFDIMPSMTQAQIDRLDEILTKEFLKLNMLERKYRQEISDLNAKHLEQWQNFCLRDKKNPNECLSE